MSRFLQTDPVGYEDGLNLYAYARNDSPNYNDPNGEEAFLVSRPTGWFGQNHMFVVVIDDDTGEVTRFTYGPQNESVIDFGQLVSLTDTNVRTDRDDRAAFEAWRSDPNAAREDGISAARIDASDEAVIAAGEAMDDALGTRQDPGDTNYVPVTGPQTLPGNANSNAAAYGVADRAVRSERRGAVQPLPPGTRNPGWEQSGRINEGTRLRQRRSGGGW